MNRFFLQTGAQEELIRVTAKCRILKKPHRRRFSTGIGPARKRDRLAVTRAVRPDAPKPVSYATQADARGDIPPCG